MTTIINSNVILKGVKFFSVSYSTPGVQIESETIDDGNEIENSLKKANIGFTRTSLKNFEVNCQSVSIFN